MLAFLISVIIAYSLGSINSAILICRFLKLPDPRSQGSHNPGATNVLRIGGKKSAIFTLMGDLLKGLIAVLIARWLSVHGFWLAIVGLVAFLGHIFPVFFKFQGGKGVATALGVLLGLNPGMAIICVITWLLVLIFTRYSSLAALIAAILAPIYTLLIADYSYFIPVLIMSGILIWRHYDNIQRLRQGMEQKVNF